MAEALVALGIFGVVIAGVVWLFSYGGQATRRLTPRLSVQQSGRRALVRP